MGNARSASFSGALLILVRDVPLGKSLIEIAMLDQIAQESHLLLRRR
jgi:hypothetical protein